MNDQVEHFIFFSHSPSFRIYRRYPTLILAASLRSSYGAKGCIICVDTSFYPQHNSEQYQPTE